MSDTSAIEWTDATWNPTVGCTKVSPGCDHCYAETLVNRFAGSNKGFPNRFDVMTIRGNEHLMLPLRWQQPKKVFVNSLSDLFHDDVPDEFIADVFAVMAGVPRHTFQVLTKRHGRMRSLLGSQHFRALLADAARQLYIDEGRRVDGPGLANLVWPLPNVWLGVSVENQQWADIRIPALLATPAAVRFLSCEPLLGAIRLPMFRCADCLRVGAWTDGDDIHYWCQTCGEEHQEARDLAGVDCVIVGGESGPRSRPMHPDWARSLRDQCVGAGVPFLFKQWGNWAPFPVFKGAEKNTFVMDAATGKGAHYALRSQPGYAEMWNVGKKAAGRELDGRTWDEMPAVVTHV